MAPTPVKSAETAGIIAASQEQKDYIEQIKNINLLSRRFAAREEKS
jgi:hypothetical protein